MAPAKQQKKATPKAYDYSGLVAGMRLHVESDGVNYAAEVVQVSTGKSRARAPVKISYRGYDGYDEWVGGARIRSKALKVVEAEPNSRSSTKATFSSESTDCPDESIYAKLGKMTNNKAFYNEGWDPTGIEGAVDANRIPWISKPNVLPPNWFIRPLRASMESGAWAALLRVPPAAQDSLSLEFIGSFDTYVLSGAMEYRHAVIKGKVEAGFWIYTPAGTIMMAPRVTETVEILVTSVGGLVWRTGTTASRNSNLITASTIQSLAKEKGTYLVPTTLADAIPEGGETPGFLTPEEKEFHTKFVNGQTFNKNDKEAECGSPSVLDFIKDKSKNDELSKRLCERVDANTPGALHGGPGGMKLENPFIVDTRKLKWIFENGIGLKPIRVSAETQQVTTMVMQNGQAPPHHHLGAGDFFLLHGRINYRAAPEGGYGPGVYMYEPCGARHEATDRYEEAGDLIYAANLYGTIAFDAPPGVLAVPEVPAKINLSWMYYLNTALTNESPLLANRLV
jgi:quercetin dioxygenase-like cupin family protein